MININMKQIIEKIFYIDRDWKYMILVAIAFWSSWAFLVYLYLCK